MPPGQGTPLQASPCLRGRYCESTRLTCSSPDTSWCKVMEKLSEGTSTSSGGSSMLHTLAWKTHLCLLPGPCLLERACVDQGTAEPASLLLLLSWGPYLRPCPLPPSQVGLALQPHLVKRSHELAPWLGSGADQWQSILRMLLLRQVTVPAPGPEESDTVAAPGREWVTARLWQLTP